MSLAQLQEADVVLGIFEKHDEGFDAKLRGVRPSSLFLSIQNKIDINPADNDLFDFCVSAKTGLGFSSLKKAIVNFFNEEVNRSQSVYLIRDRHVKIFANVVSNLESALEGLKNNKALELVAEDLKNSRADLDELIGKKFSDSLLGDIFSSFCIGK